MSPTAPSRPSTFVLAIDGPSGTGKSTVARRLATALGAGYLDTGAMYRIVTLAVLGAGVSPTDDAAVTALVAGLDFPSPTDPAAQAQQLNGLDVTADIRSAEVTAAVSPVSANPAVRAWLKERQQSLARSGRMVVEGRDIGTVIAPDAALKVYLTASEEVRAARRHGEEWPAGAAGSGTERADLEAVRQALVRRDRYDSTRTVAPLHAADDAVLLDSTDLDIDQVVGAILVLAAERGIS